jgi:hypothetical protein
MPTEQEIADLRDGFNVRFKREKNEIDAQASVLQIKSSENEANLARLRTPIPHPDACPACYYGQGIISMIRPVGANPKKPNIDRFKCENDHEW